MKQPKTHFEIYSHEFKKRLKVDSPEFLLNFAVSVSNKIMNFDKHIYWQFTCIQRK